VLRLAVPPGLRAGRQRDSAYNADRGITQGEASSGHRPEYFGPAAGATDPNGGLLQPVVQVEEREMRTTPRS
jgi:hypothetical protein